jgi:ribonuclease D
MNFQLSITKDEINLLPNYRFDGDIELIETKEGATVAALALQDEKILGFDTETRAAFKKGESYDVSLLQLATSTKAYLFRLNKFSMPKELIGLLADKTIIKTGVAVRDDIKALKKLSPFSDESFIDLAEVAKEKKIKNFGLRALTAIFLGQRLSKKAKISNWERETLTPIQIAYAASDAVVGYEIYQRLCK